MSFSFPLALIGLLTIPYFVWLGWPRGTFSRNRERLSLILRILIVLFIVLGLSGMQVVKAADQLAVVFLIDASDSIDQTTRLNAEEYVNNVMRRMGPNDEAAVIVFGADALVERPMSPVRELGSVDSTPLPVNTDLAEAIRLALALYPSGSARRMVILSDGLPTVGNAEDAARLAAASGVEIVVVPFSVTLGQEVLVESVGAPTRVDEGQTFDLGINIQSTRDTEATVRVLGGGQLIHEETVRLNTGGNRFVLPVVAGEPGLTSYRVQVAPVGEDHFYQNNELAAFTQITGPPRVLVVRKSDEESDYLTQALLDAGLLVDVAPPESLPFDLASLSSYSSVVLVNIPASDLSQRRMLALQSYVRDLGGGLVVVGGDSSYGVGGYFQTPLEEMLPVEMQLKEQERIPQLALVFVIDKSGSMSDVTPSGATKVELAKEAIIRSIQLLGPLDRVGVIAFDDVASWVVDLQPLSDPDSVANQVGTIRADGGTDIYDGLLAMSRVLPDDPSTLKHVVLLTDGGASPGGIPELVTEMYDEHNITLSVVAIGDGYADFIETLPELAGGRFHFAEDVSTIPEIFTQETVLATRAYIIEETFTPTISSNSPIIEGITETPPLYGYIGTSIKPAGQEILSTAQEDPLLASWRYGLGRTVAWTSDATNRWSVDWVGWDGFPRFWGQMVRWTITEGINQNVEVTIVPQGEQAVVTVDALDGEGNFLNGLELDAMLVDPSLNGTPLTLQQVAPGRYEGSFNPTDSGAYFVRVAGVPDENNPNDLTAAVAQTTGWVLGYSAEYGSAEADPAYLSHLANITGGAVVREPADIFAHNLSVNRATQPIWPWLLLAAVILLPFDIGVRRLVVTRADALKAWRWLTSPRASAPAQVETGSSRVGALFDAKDRARATRREDDDKPARSVVMQPRRPQPAPRAEEGQAEPRPAPEPAERSSAKLASTLLAARRAREEKERED